MLSYFVPVMRMNSATSRFGYLKNQTMAILICMFTMISSFQHSLFALHGLIAHLKGKTEEIL
uniref:WD-repeat protein n=1 Tax=Rhizophora mucronata TaxID=61149 RepID=A0A2P2MFJ9_RHIMU